MIGAQLPARRQAGREATYVIDNDGDLAALERAASAVWRALIARA